MFGEVIASVVITPDLGKLSTFPEISQAGCFTKGNGCLVKTIFINIMPTFTDCALVLIHFYGI